MVRYEINLLLSVIASLLVLSCTGKSTEILNLGSSTGDTDPGYIFTTGSDGNHRAVAVYDIQGNVISHTNFRHENAQPRGLAVLDENTVLMTTDVTDQIFSLDTYLNKTNWYGSNQFNGSIADIVYDPTTQLVFATENNNIEVFDNQANRVTSMFITQTSGACTLSNPQGLTINTNGHLVVANAGGPGAILTYDITTTPPTCLTSVAFGNAPLAVLQHSDGYLYIATQTNDQIYRADIDGTNAVVVWATDTTIIDRPSALAELPNGNLLVGVSNKDTIEQITTAGVRVGAEPFIYDEFSLNVSDIVILGGQ